MNQDNDCHEEGNQPCRHPIHTAYCLLSGKKKNVFKKGYISEKNRNIETMNYYPQPSITRKKNEMRKKGNAKKT